ncbi:chemotaxis protein CheW [Uliginosibacterium sediminicola]|uniref:Chemotaxis protein CheW n=1 Tax=Uliginosibacterium sediminicola TaxID=2024550 RepID=A0ABU9YTU8_9RHOO
MVKYKNIDLDDSLAGVIRYMNAVEEYREMLQNLQSVWDNLTLLGQLSGTGTDMSGTRQAFNQLTTSLLNQLGTETLKKCVLEVGSKAQVAIDILIRNLYERTADIGFLATDEDIRSFLKQSAAGVVGDELAALRASLHSRFAEYVAKYSVYSDIVLLDTEGRVLLRLDQSVEVTHSKEPLVRASLETPRAYVESYGSLDLLPGKSRSLVYSYRVSGSDGVALGVLCLCFRFGNEMAGIFSHLVPSDDWSVVTLLDEQGQVIASSDEFHIPVGAQLAPVRDAEYRIVRFGPQEYIAVTRSTQGYQGYFGPGWTGHVMLPVQHAFNKDASEMLQGLAREVLDTVMQSPSLFGAALRDVPVQAARIQSDLNRSVWNGNVRQSGAARAQNPGFSKILLWEISNTGRRTKEVFERSINNLHQTVVSAILQDSCFQAALAIDIMDRNLYERANDCRWWALTSVFRELLAEPHLPADAEARIGEILAYINGLYTVYSNLVVFDVEGRIIAVSNPAERGKLGQPVGEEWHRRVMALGDSQGYAVSSFAATPFYDGRHTYIYGAAIRSPDNARVVGGVGIVFDSEPQFAAMLRDALPRDEAGRIQPGSFGVFVNPQGAVIACSDTHFRPGEQIAIDAEFLCLPAGTGRAGIVALDGEYYAVGARSSAGYREFKGSADAYQEAVISLILVPLCETSLQSVQTEVPRPKILSDRAGGEALVEIATFRIGQEWYGVRSAQVLEAVDANGLTVVPGAGQDLAGYLRYEGMPIPVFQIEHIVHGGEPVASGSSEARQVLVLRRNDVTHFGLLVDALGEIPEVTESRLAELPPVLAGGYVLADSILAVDGAGDDRMLLVLGMDRLYGRLSKSITEPMLVVARKHAAAG